MKVKYVMLPINGVPTPFMFPETIIHADFVSMMGFKPGHVIAAGFIAHEGITPYGRSESLDIGGKDEAVKSVFAAINAQFNGH